MTFFICEYLCGRKIIQFTNLALERIFNLIKMMNQVKIQFKALPIITYEILMECLRKTMKSQYW
jgi:hypothetical protein